MTRWRHAAHTLTTALAPLFAPLFALSIALLLALGPCLPARAEDAPLWEFGLGATVLRYPDYPGSDQSRNLVLPLPYFIYRGDFLRSDRNGVRGVLFDTDRIDLNLSLAATPPLDSSNSDARAGMPNLNGALEFGPSVDWIVWRGADRGSRLTVALPVRAAFTVEAPPRFIGFDATPHVNLDLVDPVHAAGWNFGLQAGLLYEDRRQDAYYYSVDPQYATATRRAYAASGGFAGWQLTTALSRRFVDYWFGAFVRYDSLAGSMIEDSPLVRSTHGWYAGIGLARMIGESSRRVPRRDDEPAP